MRLTLGRVSSKALVKHEFGKSLGIGIVTLRQDDDRAEVPVPGSAGGRSKRTSPSSGSDTSSPEQRTGAGAGAGAGAEAASPSEPQQSHLYSVGTVARVTKLAKVKTKRGEEHYSMWVEGVARMHVRRYVKTAPYRIAVVRRLANATPSALSRVTDLAPTLGKAGKELFQLTKLLGGVLPMSDLDVGKLAQNEPEKLAFTLVFVTTASVEDKMAVMSIDDDAERMRAALELISQQLELLRISGSIRAKVSEKLKSGQRKFYLRQQLDAIRKELGEDGDGGAGEDDEMSELMEKLDEAELPPPARKMADKELRRLKRMHPASPERSMVVTYLEWLADLPWGVSSGIHASPAAAQAQLDADHSGLDKVKRRIIEFLAVRQLNPSSPGPILLFVGPPGVGKTSLGRSIATALRRQFQRMSLGGVRDVAEIRGHRRTYIGALPGTVVQTLKRAGTNDPVVLLDEIDKLGGDARGDPSSALLEVLDPEQNSTFTDHYLAVPVDLSKVLFICTANTTDTIPPALLDRMEVVRLSGYTRAEKTDIADRHLWPKQLARHGLSSRHATLEESTLRDVVDHYTREAGVRGLERKLAALCRHVAVRVAAHRAEAVSKVGELEEDSEAAAEAGDGGDASSVETQAGSEAEVAALDDGFERIAIDEDVVRDALGPTVYEPEMAGMEPSVGVVTGLAWTRAGGELLFVEATGMAGSGHVRLTGQLGDVMKESAHTALRFVAFPECTRCALTHVLQLGLEPEPVKHTDIHVHFPAGAIPKDGPSAGAAITTALVSLLTGRAVRHDTAMTGEATLRGAVLPVGGIKDKVLGAHRGGIRRVLLPRANAKDAAEVPQEVLDDMEIVFVDKLFEVLDLVFADDQPGCAEAAVAADSGQAVAGSAVEAPVSAYHRCGAHGRASGRGSTSASALKVAGDHLKRVRTRSWPWGEEATPLLRSSL